MARAEMNVFHKLYWSIHLRSGRASLLVGLRWKLGEVARLVT
jgi:hypothetical protein